MEITIEIISILILLILSALVSGSEVAFFSLSPVQLDKIKSSATKGHSTILHLLKSPEKLLATILIANNLINVGIVILSTFMSNSILEATELSGLKATLFQIAGVTFLLLLFGEIIPKVFASHYSVRFSYFMAYPMLFLTKFFYILSTPLANSSSIFKKKFVREKHNLSIDDLSEALDLTKQHISADKEILEGIVKFGYIEAKEIIKPRVDVVAVDIQHNFTDLLKTIREIEYSRIPVYHKTFDNIKGILYVKDLLRYINEDNAFKWQKLIRKPYIIPESKKIDVLLNEFQQNKIHMAIVVDEYGGASGIVTMEDIIEEILGEISDEYDAEEEQAYTKIDDNTYIFEGKTMLNDFCKILDMDDEFFEPERGDADTLAGFVLELTGEIPKKGTEMVYKKMKIKIETVDKRRIKQIKIILN